MFKRLSTVSLTCRKPYFYLIFFKTLQQSLYSFSIFTLLIQLFLFLLIYSFLSHLIISLNKFCHSLLHRSYNPQPVTHTHLPKSTQNNENPHLDNPQLVEIHPNPHSYNQWRSIESPNPKSFNPCWCQLKLSKSD